jgi:hypothetical protein
MPHPRVDAFAAREFTVWTREGTVVRFTWKKHVGTDLVRAWEDTWSSESGDQGSVTKTGKLTLLRGLNRWTLASLLNHWLCSISNASPLGRRTCVISTSNRHACDTWVYASLFSHTFWHGESSLQRMILCTSRHWCTIGHNVRRTSWLPFM